MLANTQREYLDRPEMCLPSWRTEVQGCIESIAYRVNFNIQRKHGSLTDMVFITRGVILLKCVQHPQEIVLSPKWHLKQFVCV